MTREILLADFSQFPRYGCTFMGLIKQKDFASGVLFLEGFIQGAGLLFSEFYSTPFDRNREILTPLYEEYIP